MTSGQIRDVYSADLAFSKRALILIGAGIELFLEAFHLLSEPPIQFLAYVLFPATGVPNELRTILAVLILLASVYEYTDYIPRLEGPFGRTIAIFGVLFGAVSLSPSALSRAFLYLPLMSGLLLVQRSRSDGFQIQEDTKQAIQISFYLLLLGLVIALWAPIAPVVSSVLLITWALSKAGLTGNPKELSVRSIRIASLAKHREAPITISILVLAGIMMGVLFLDPYFFDSNAPLVFLRGLVGGVFYHSEYSLRAYLVYIWTLIPIYTIVIVGIYSIIFWINTGKRVYSHYTDDASPAPERFSLHMYPILPVSIVGWLISESIDEDFILTGYADYVAYHISKGVWQVSLEIIIWSILATWPLLWIAWRFDVFRYCFNRCVSYNVKIRPMDSEPDVKYFSVAFLVNSSICLLYLFTYPQGAPQLVFGSLGDILILFVPIIAITSVSILRFLNRTQTIVILVGVFFMIPMIPWGGTNLAQPVFVTTISILFPLPDDTTLNA